MSPVKTIARSAALVAVLSSMPAGGAVADVTIRFGSGHGGHHRHGPRYSHGVPFINRYPHLRPSPGPRLYGHRGRYVLGPGCSPIAERHYDRHGRLVIRYLTLCHDRFGRPYVIGSPGHGHP